MALDVLRGVRLRLWWVYWLGSVWVVAGGP